MKRIPLILALLLALLTGAAQGATLYWGVASPTGVCLNTAADSAGLGVPAGANWSRKFTTAFTACSSGDVLRQVGSSADTLASSYSDPANVDIIGKVGCVTIVTVKKVTLSGTVTMTNLDLEAALFINKDAGAFTATGCRFVGPGTGTEVGVTGYGMGFDAGTLTMTNCVFDSCRTTNGDEGELVFIGATSATAQVFTGCTFNTSDLTEWSAYSGGYAQFINCTFSNETTVSGPGIQFRTTADLDSIAFQGCTFNSRVAGYTGIVVNDVKKIRVNACTAKRWGLSDTGGNPLFYFVNAATAARPKTLIVTNNTIAREQDLATGSQSFVVFSDTSRVSTFNFTGNTVQAANATNFDYLYFGKSHADTCKFVNNTLYAGVIMANALSASDTTALYSFGRGWTVTGNVIDHTNWVPTSGPSVALQLCCSASTISGNTIKTGVCSHIVLFGDDTIKGTKYWRASDQGFGASRNTISGNTFVGLSMTTDAMYGLVDKARSNVYVNNPVIIHGSTASTSSAWYMAGDSTKVHNNDITMYDGGGGAHGVWDDNRGLGTGTQAKGILCANNMVRGNADYVLTSRAGDGSGVKESNNCFAIRYSTRFDVDGDSMATNSFTDSTSWRMKWGGMRDMAGITANSFGAVGVGLWPAPADALWGQGANAPFVWEFLPSGHNPYDHVATNVQALLDEIEDGILPTVTAGDMDTFYTIPGGQSSNSDQWRKDIILRKWETLPDTSRAKIDFRVW